MNNRFNLYRFVKSILDLFPFLSISLKFLRDNSRLLRKPKITPLGFKLIGNHHMETGCFEPKETVIIKRIVQKIDVFINVGANIGYYCCIALSNNKQTVAFEPIGTNLRYLYKNVKANDWGDNIEIFPMALSDRKGIIDIFGSNTGASIVKGWAGMQSKYSTSVPTSTLDNILGTRFNGKKCLVLVDIEGAEDLFLQGANQFLSRNPKPVWMVEISFFEHQPDGVSINPNIWSSFQRFWENGYEAWTADGDLQFVSKNLIRRIIYNKQNTLSTHNFLFVEKGKIKELMGIND